ncbi:NUDIX hydrolase [Amycolatopsis minnesotensis]|uniref:NUDIX domain-containing protein n=1 Tax=Amycolatopsis minnesotensis TaxID=337894 RepID=A0ABN2RJ31_9PSEU
MDPEAPEPVRCVGGIVHDGDGRLLLVLRANDPGRGKWSLPGGKVERGETDAEAVIREMSEETGLLVRPGALAGTVVRGRFEIHDYFCTIADGDLRPGDDASATRWVDPREYTSLEQSGDLVPGLTVALSDWNALPFLP